MTELAITVIISIVALALLGLTYALVSRWIDLKERMFFETQTLNTTAASTALSEALEAQLKLHDKRINDTWTAVSHLKEELSAFKLQMGMKKRVNNGQ